MRAQDPEAAGRSGGGTAWARPLRRPSALPAWRAFSRRAFGLAGPGARAAPAGACPQIPRAPASWAGPPGRGLPGLAPAVPAQGDVPGTDRVPVLGAGARAQHAPARVVLQDTLLPAPGARCPRGGLGDLAPAQAAVLAADDADRCAAAGAVPLLFPPGPALIKRAASTGPGPGRPSAGPPPGAAGRRAGPPG